MIEAAEANATHQQDTPSVSAKPRLLDQMRQVIRVKHYSIRTEKTYLSWVKHFIRWSGMRHPSDMGAPEIEAFLSMLANQRDTFTVLDIMKHTGYLSPVTGNSVAGIGLPMWSGESRMLCGFFASGAPLWVVRTGSRKARRCSTGSPTRSVPPTPIGLGRRFLQRTGACTNANQPQYRTKPKPPHRHQRTRNYRAL